MPRCRVVNPDVERLFLVDVHRRELERLRNLQPEKTTPEELALAAKYVARAEKDADWIDVRKVLNSGERREMYARMYLAGIDGRLHANPLTQRVSRTVAYLVDWSLVGQDGKKIPIEGLPAEAVQKALDIHDPDTVLEIGEAISWHEEEMERAKNAWAETGVNEPSAISASAA